MELENVKEALQKHLDNVSDEQFAKELKEAGIEAIVSPAKKVKKLKQIAKDIYNEKIFITNNPSVINRNFVVFAFMSSTQIPDDAVAVYEYYDKASSMSLNGLPVFMSCYFLNQAEFDEIMRYIKLIEIAMDEI